MGSDITLPLYYKTLFELSFEHKYAIGDIEAMLPFERDLFLGMIEDRLEERERAASRND